MNWIRNKLCLGMAIFGILAPLQVHAAGRDAVTLTQDGNEVGVSLGMSNASEEKITTVAVSLEVKTQDLSQVKVEFAFSQDLGGTKHGFIYHEDTGRLDIYAASGKSESLFNGEELNLGNVQVRPVNPDQSISADIGYCKNSFQTANSSYGDKTPVVEDEVMPVTIQIGNGSLTPPDTGPENPVNPDNGNSANPGTDSGGSGGNSHGSGRDEGLYDETTRFTNDPASAQLISNSVVKREGKETAPINLTTGAAAAIAGKNNAGSGKVALSGTKGKVSVISPKNGPASILVSKENKEASGEDMPDGLLAGADKESFGEKADGLFGRDSSEEGDSGEILLDQEKGGAVDNTKSKIRSRIILICGVSAGIVIAVGTVVILLRKNKDPMPVKGRRKKKRKKRRRKKRREK